MADEIVERVREAADIVEVVGEHVSLKRAGASYKGLCPFHSEKTPSFVVNPARQTFHCFGCNEGGDVFSFIMRYHGLGFGEALRQLAARYHVPLPAGRFGGDDKRGRLRATLEEITRQAARIYHAFLLESPRAERARRYLDERGIPRPVVERFLLGYAPDEWRFIAGRLAGAFPPEMLVKAGLLVAKENGGRPYDRFRDRLLCPVFQLTGGVAGFGGRILGDGQPKYLNTDKTLLFDKSRLLFGLYQNREAIRKARRALVVEGNFDLLSLAAAGIDIAVAPLGTALTQQQVRLLKGYVDEVILLFDGDAAGRKAAMRCLPLFLAEMVEVRVAVLPEGEDPDSFVRAVGRQGVEKVVAEAQELSSYAYDFLVERYGTSVTGKARICAEVRELLAPLAQDAVARTLLVNFFSERLGVLPAQIEAGVRAVRRWPPAPAGEGGDAPPSLELPLKQRQLLAFLFAWPQYLSAFVDAGLADVLAEGPGRRLLVAMQELYAKEPDAPPERLLDQVQGAEKRLIAALITALPDYGGETVEDLAAEMIAWLQKERHRFWQRRLTARIAAAQKAGDVEELRRLMEEKRRLDQENPLQLQ